MNNPYSAPDALMIGDELGDDTYAPKFFSLQGRIGRVRYIGYAMGAQFLTMFVFGIIASVLTPMTLKGSSSSGLYVALGMIYIPAIAAGLIMTRRRLHDLGNSGWLCLLLIVPFVGALFWLYLVLVPGNDGANQYGPKPDNNSSWAWLLILLVPAIIGILAAVAIPAYSDYTKKAKALHEQQLQQQQAPAPQDQQTQQ